MNVILDTNIFVNNYFLKSPKFIGLFDYLRKTDSNLYLISLVKDEVIQKYIEEVELYVSSVDTFERNLKEKPEVLNGDVLIKQYQEYLKSFIKSNFWVDIIEVDIENIAIPYNEILKRAVKKEAPFNKNGKGFRDTVIWCAVQEIIKKTPKSESCCFISKDKEAFGDKAIREELKKELVDKNLELVFFNTLEEFLSVYGKKMEFITEDYLYDFLKEQETEQYINELITDRVIDGKLDCDGLSKYPNYTINDFYVEQLEITSFYIYEETGDSFYVSVDLGIDVSLEIECAKKIRKNGREIELQQEEVESGWLPEHIEIEANRKTKELKIIKDRKITIFW